MKKNILNLALVAVSTTLIISSCNKEDVNAPVVTINGGDQTISLQGTYTEQGATAKDDEDGSVTPTVGGDVVNVNLTGVYNVKYMATDAAGNEGTATRKVTVVNDADDLAGMYHCTIQVSGESDFNYDTLVTASTTLNNRIHFTKFAAYKNNNKIYADVNGTSITLPSQDAVLVGNPAADRTFGGTGSKTANGFTLDYTEKTNGNTINTHEIFVKK